MRFLNLLFIKSHKIVYQIWHYNQGENSVLSFKGAIYIIGQRSLKLYNFIAKQYGS